jgi:integrase/recombinase XerD
MLTIYRRHRNSCRNRHDRYAKRDKCACWIEGTIDGKYIRQALKTRSWERAEELKREFEDSSCPRPVTLSVGDAIEKFYAECRLANLRAASLKKYRQLLGGLEKYCARRSITALRLITVDHLRGLRETWQGRKRKTETGEFIQENISPVSIAKKTQLLRSFFRFCQDSGWIFENPAKKLRQPIVDSPQTVPFTEEEFQRILAATYQYRDSKGRTGQENSQRLRALVLVMRWTGLRIQDTAQLRCDHVQDDTIVVRQTKTRVDVRVPVPPEVIAALEQCPRSSREYFFWSGESTILSRVGDWHRSLSTLFSLAGIKGGHSHKFRHLFSVSLLAKGVPLETVSILLGHKSIRVTERYYAAFVPARRTTVEEAVKRAWQKPSLLRVK